MFIVGGHLDKYRKYVLFLFGGYLDNFLMPFSWSLWFQSFLVLAFRASGVQGFRGSGVQGFRGSGVRALY